MVIAHHLILTGYGHWLPNDPRGSMSVQVYTPELAGLAEAHFGRRRVQPSREELRAFYRVAAQRLAYPILWFAPAMRDIIAAAIGDVIEREKLTCYACAVLTNHVHLLIRRHRLSGKDILKRLKEGATAMARSSPSVPDDHPVFSADECILFKSDVPSMKNCIRYIHDNYPKHGLRPVVHEFVIPYNNWPFHKNPSPEG